MRDYNTKFAAKEKEFFDRVIELSPLTASHLGLHQYDGQIDRVNEANLRKAIALQQEILSALMEFKEHELHPDQFVTRKLLAYQNELSVFNFDHIRQWERDSDAARFLGHAIFPLYSGQYAPIEDRIKSIISRLSFVDRLINDFRERLKNPVTLWLRNSITSITGTCAFLISIRESTRDSIGKDLWNELDNAVNHAITVLNSYGNYLESLIPDAQEEFAIGAEKFEKLIKLRHLGMTVSEIKEYGYQSLKQAQERMNEIASTWGVSSIAEAQDHLSKKALCEFSEILDCYRSAIERSCEFVRKEGFADVPEDVRSIKVVETPEYLRHILPYAAYIPPARFEKNPHGTYLVTPPCENSSLKKFSPHHICNTCIHEAFPGHHLQLSIARKNPSHVRLLAGSASEFIEGWALYCEEETFKLDFENTPEREFVMLSDIVFRAVRVIIDIDLSSGRMTYNYAMKMLMENTGMSESEAITEVNRYTETPGYQLSYLTGKHLIEKMRESFSKSSNFSARTFHDTLLENGNLPVFLQKLVLESVFSVTDQNGITT